MGVYVPIEIYRKNEHVALTKLFKEFQRQLGLFTIFVAHAQRTGKAKHALMQEQLRMFEQAYDDLMIHPRSSDIIVTDLSIGGYLDMLWPQLDDVEFE